MMKRKIITLCIILSGLFALCFLDRAVIIKNNSKEYSDFEISNAIFSTTLYFKLTFKDCDLLTIGYKGDQNVGEAKELVKNSIYDKAIIITCSFKSGDNWQDTGLEPNKVYENWEFVLGRVFGFVWLVENHGYC